MINQWPTTLLQSGLDRLRINSQAPSFVSVLIFFGILGLLFLILFIYNHRQTNQKTRKKYNQFVARKTASNIGLQPAHIQLMDKLVRSLKISHPVLLYSNRKMLEDFLRNGIELIEKQTDKSDDERAVYIRYIYEIKEIIDIHSKKSIGLKSTHLIKPNQDFLVITPSGEKFRTKVVNNLSSMLICSPPKMPKTHAVELRRGLRVTPLFPGLRVLIRKPGIPTFTCVMPINW